MMKIKELPPLGGIYIIKNNKNNRAYIGKTNNFQHRLSSHYRQLLSSCHHNQHLQAEWEEYGESSFSIDILHFIDDEQERCTKEEELIRSSENLYNIAIHNAPKKKFLTPRKVKVLWGKKQRRNAEYI